MIRLASSVRMWRLHQVARCVRDVAGAARWGLVAAAGGLVILVVVLLVVIIFVPSLAVDRSGLSRTDWLTHVESLRATILQALGGLVVAAGAVVAGLNFSEVRRANRATQELQRRGQVTERFSKAIEQLGFDSLAVRLGGIYALEQIAFDSAELHWPIMEVLTAYLREHAPVRAAADDPNWVPLPADHQAIVTVLGRRNAAQDPAGKRLDLRGANLRGARLRGARLRGANLSGVDLCAADLSEVDLREADLFGVDFRGSDVRGLNLSGAHVSGVDLRGADLRTTMGLTLEHLSELCVDEVRLPRELEDHIAQLIAEPASGAGPEADEGPDS